jgi:5-methylcytosine-specific restriction endonuclease McrA
VDAAAAAVAVARQTTKKKEIKDIEEKLAHDGSTGAESKERRLFLAPPILARSQTYVSARRENERGDIDELDTRAHAQLTSCTLCELTFSICLDEKMRDLRG